LAFLDGKDPLQGIFAYAVEEPVRHWRFVPYGYCELYETEWENPARSGLWL
jgi:suppressor of fused